MMRTGTRLWRLVLCVLLSAPALSWAAETNALNPDATLTVTKPAAKAVWQQRFTLGPGDVLNFNLLESPELARTGVVVGPDGRVSYLQAQDVMASGLTVDELRAKFDEALGKYYRSPRTIITPVAYRSKKYVVMGAVVQGGVFQFDRPITIVEALSRAGGFQVGPSDKGSGEIADFSRSMLVRRGERVPVDFEKLFKEGDLTQNAAVEPDDFLYVPPNELNEVYLLGQVRGPGPIPYQPNMTVISAIVARGGYTERAWRRRILVVRGSLQKPEAIAVDAADILAARKPDFKLQPKDIVYVAERPWAIAEDLVRTAVYSFVNAALVEYAGTEIRIIR